MFRSFHSTSFAKEGTGKGEGHSEALCKMLLIMDNLLWEEASELILAVTREERDAWPVMLGVPGSSARFQTMCKTAFSPGSSSIIVK